LKKYFVTGLLIWIPLAITVWVLNLIVTTMDQSCAAQAISARLAGRSFVSLGLLLSLLVVLLTSCWPPTSSASGWCRCGGCWRIQW
jgi:uncharacterized membrane protein